MQVKDCVTVGVREGRKLKSLVIVSMYLCNIVVAIAACVV